MRVLRGILPAIILGATLAAGVASAQEAVDNPGRLLASNCFQCHGTNGAPAAGGFDRIAGGSAKEVASELQEMRAEAILGSEHPIMTVHSQAYSLSEIDLISRYLSTVGATTSGSFTLSVSKTGTGKGTVTSSPSGISCGSTCSKSFASGTQVTLTATSASGSTFTGWSGACSGSATTCTVGMTAARSVVASFATSGTGTTAQYTLSLEKDGKSYGSVTSSPAGIACGLGCEKASMKAAKGTVISLTATPAAGRRFIGWSGACRGTAKVCAVTLRQSLTAKASFK